MNRKTALLLLLAALLAGALVLGGAGPEALKTARAECAHAQGVMP